MKIRCKLGFHTPTKERAYDLVNYVYSACKNCDAPLRKTLKAKRWRKLTYKKFMDQGKGRRKGSF